MASGSSSKRLLSEDEDGPDTTMEAKAESSTVQPTSARATTKKKRRAAASPGIVYISRLPPGMTPQKVRHLMARWGEIGKVYAQRRDAPTGYDPSVSNSNKKKKEKHRSADFTEAWVEFLDKSVAKTIANMLNAQVIGGRPGDRWRDDIWTMKYLSGFKWEMLGEQVGMSCPILLYSEYFIPYPPRPFTASTPLSFI
ncbi:hypothetical protein BCR39DRAFT_524103 [Naematelia encephala]|uniref:18S rRNA factor 2 n=1 Tax=Naematelia encephala TaxID=71784 RepID=A0A1Y2BBF9_9TREE|nr:hypothetical protein BCR39DRAFT_524103 [Naematelia encephala]